MKKLYAMALPGVIALLLSSAPWTVSQAEASGNITGIVIYKDIRASGVGVYFLDAVNAVIKGRAFTDRAGYFDSGPLPAGDYKIRFETDIDTGLYSQMYYGTTGDDVFDLGAIITVTDGSSLSMEIVLSPEVPTEIVKCEGRLYGILTDAKTGTLLQNIHVSAVNAMNAMPIAEAVTGADGSYGFLQFLSPCVLPKIRFSDPSGYYLAEYAGAGSADDFSLGAVINWRDVKVELNESLAQITPDQAVQNIVDQVAALGLASDTSLTSGLNTVSKLTTDANPNNDKSGCNILSSFINRVETRLGHGSLTQSEADALIQSAGAAKTAIGCL